MLFHKLDASLSFGTSHPEQGLHQFYFGIIDLCSEIPEFLIVESFLLLLPDCLISGQHNLCKCGISLSTFISWLSHCSLSKEYSRRTVNSLDDMGSLCLSQCLSCIGCGECYFRISMIHTAKIRTSDSLYSSVI